MSRPLKLFRWFWAAHKWAGLSAALIFAMIGITGFLLLIKKDFDWVQPPTQRGEAGSPAEFLTLDEILTRVYAQGHPELTRLADVDRIDFRPGKHVHKVRSKRGHLEIQVCAVTGEILSVAVRRSDWIESLHDGSFFAGWVHDYVMPVVAITLLFLTISGFWIWLAPILWKRRRRRERAAQTATDSTTSSSGETRPASSHQ